MAFDFILTLTSNDGTIAEARARLDEALEGGVRHNGFKDVGLLCAELTGIADATQASGGLSHREVVNLDAGSELVSARATVDYLRQHERNKQYRQLSMKNHAETCKGTCRF
jgi:hypothetical protein